MTNFQAYQLQHGGCKEQIYFFKECTEIAGKVSAIWEAVFSMLYTCP